MSVKKFSIALFAGVILLSGCTQNKPVDISNTSNTSEIADPMSVPAENSADLSSVISYAYGTFFTEDNMKISDNKFLISPILKGDKTAVKVGLMVFADGVLQKYSTQNSDDKKYMMIFETQPLSDTELNLIVDLKTDSTLNKHFISIAAMTYPEYVPTAEVNPRFGNNHKIISPFSIEISDEIAAVGAAENYRAKAAQNSVLTKKQSEKFGIDETAGDGYITDFGLLQTDNLLETTYSMSHDDNKLMLKFYAYTTEADVNNYRVTFFVNHEPVKFNGDCEFLDITMEGEKITETEIELNDVNPGDFVYFIAVPLGQGSACYKSDSKMVLDANAPSQSAQSSAESASAPASEPEKFTEKVMENRIYPKFSVGEFAYANVKNSGQYTVYKFNSKGEIAAKLNDVMISSSNGKTLSAINHNASNTVLTLYDSDFNIIKSKEIPEDLGTHFEFDENRIVYFTDESGGSKLRMCDRNLENQKTLMTLSDENNERFNDIALADEFVAFTMTDKTGNFYGICGFDGNFSKYKKSGMESEVQVIGNAALWHDKNVNTVGGAVSSGEIEICRNGKFEVVKTENPLESQNVFLTSEDEFFTWFSDEGVLRQYKNGVKTAEIPLEKGEYIYSIVRAGKNIFAGTTVGGEFKLKIRELG